MRSQVAPATMELASAARRRDPIVVTNVSWTAMVAVDFEQWVHSGRKLGALGRGVGWWIGDWLRFGNDRYGERYAQASRITGYDAQTLMNMVYVASRVDPSRRRESLSWSHHAEIAPLTSDEQEYWLDKAAALRLSVKDLRLMRREERRRTTLLAPAAERDESHAAVCPECGRAMSADRPLRAVPAVAVERPHTIQPSLKAVEQ